MPYIAYHFGHAAPARLWKYWWHALGELPFESFDANETGFTAYIRERGDKGLNLDEFSLGDFTLHIPGPKKIEDSNWNEEGRRTSIPLWLTTSFTIRAPFMPDKPNKIRTNNHAQDELWYRASPKQHGLLW